MAADIQSVAGASIGITASAPSTYDITGYAALSYTRIGEVTNLGSIGRMYNLIKHNPIDTRATRKLKGSYDEGQFDMKVAFHSSEAGQAVARAAASSDADYSFRLKLQNGTFIYFQAKVMSFQLDIGGVDDIVSATIKIEITSSTTGEGVIFDMATGSPV